MLLARFDRHWRVLLSRLVLFGFIYPAERARVPAAIMRELLRRLDAELEAPAPRDHRCQGTILSREQYLVAVAVTPSTSGGTATPACSRKAP